MLCKLNSKAEAIVQRKNINKKQVELEEAVKWCKINGKKSQSALKTGMFPLIKDRGTIDRRLNGKKMNTKKEQAKRKTTSHYLIVFKILTNSS